jgi:hypothetical protein
MLGFLASVSVRIRLILTLTWQRRLQKQLIL